MHSLKGTVQEYAWGSLRALPEFMGFPASGKPQAELWLGAHPSSPSELSSGNLLKHIQQSPNESLGSDVFSRFQSLPYLLKVLAVDQPLSLQVHPNETQARAGFAREESTGVARSDPKRSYKDACHKPELIVALTPYEALCGFRRVEEIVEQLKLLGAPSVSPFIQTLEQKANALGLQEVVERLFRLIPSERREVMAEVSQSLHRLSGRSPEFALAAELAERYPVDIGVLMTLFLNYVQLAPGEGLFLPAGNIHAYVKGLGVEIMASSDNVLRGGLTPKHIDVPELLAVLKYELGPVPILRPIKKGSEEVWDTPAPEFRLSRLTVAGDHVTPTRVGPEILLCSDGEVMGPGITLRRGHAAWVGASDGPYTLSGRGQVFRATVGDCLKF